MRVYQCQIVKKPVNALVRSVEPAKTPIRILKRSFFSPASPRQLFHPPPRCQDSLFAQGRAFSHAAFSPRSEAQHTKA